MKSRAQAGRPVPVQKEPDAGPETFLMTPEGYQALCGEYDSLLKQERPRVVETVAWAASNGDRSENADYHYGKKRLREIDKRVRYLETRINQAKVIRTGGKKSEVVSFGATVSLSFETGEEKIVRIVGEDEIYGPEQAIMKISYRSPLAKLLDGRRLGDEILFKRPKGEVYITIERIEFAEAEGTEHA